MINRKSKSEREQISNALRLSQNDAATAVVSNVNRRILRDIAAQLHKFAEEGGTHRAPTLQETHLLFKTALMMPHSAGR